MPAGWDGPKELDRKQRDRSAIADAWKIARQEQKRSAEADLQSTGEGAESIPSSQSTTLTLSPVEWYAIRDDTDVIHTASGDIHVLTLDCIRLDAFWKQLQANAELYDVLLNYHNAATATEVRNRVRLLKAVLRPEHRCFVTIFTSADRFPGLVEATYTAGMWCCVHIAPEEDAETEWMDTALETAVELQEYTVVTSDLYDDEARPAQVTFSRHPTLAEEAFLDEIFSLNHVPDAPIGNGGTTPPSPVGPAPIVLTDGGFSFEGDAEFWSTCTPTPAPQVLDEDALTPYPEKAKAFCRTTKQVFDVIPGDLQADEGDYAITLRANDDALCFHIGIDGKDLVVEAAVAPILLEPVDDTGEELVLENLVTKETYVSPKKEKKVEVKKKERMPLQDIQNSNPNERPRTFSPAKRNPNLDKENVNPEEFNVIRSKKTGLTLSRNETTGVFVPDRTAKKLVFYR